MNEAHVHTLVDLAEQHNTGKSTAAVSSLLSGPGRVRRSRSTQVSTYAFGYWGMVGWKTKIPRP